ncbi:MAG: metal ABC transporter permease [Waddliaceae bacterium]
MTEFITALQTNPLLLSAVIAGLLASIVSGIIGSYVVVKRIAFISGGIAHSVLGGMGFALYLNRVYGMHFSSPLLGAVFAAIVSALVIGWIHINYKERIDSAIAALWSIGMAIGIIFVSQTPGYNVDLTHFLIGNILWTSKTDLIILSLLDFFVIFSVLLLHKRFLALAFDENQARLQGANVNALSLFLLILIAISTVLLIQVVGIVLVMMMLTIPASIANLFTYRLSRMMMIAIALSMAFTLSGIITAFYFNWPVGATIALIAGLTYPLLLLSGKKVHN